MVILPCPAFGGRPITITVRAKRRIIEVCIADDWMVTVEECDSRKSKSKKGRLRKAR
jgi:hypothetical protein